MLQEKEITETLLVSQRKSNCSSSNVVNYFMTVEINNKKLVKLNCSSWPWMAKVSSLKSNCIIEFGRWSTALSLNHNLCAFIISLASLLWFLTSECFSFNNSSSTAIDVIVSVESELSHTGLSRGDVGVSDNIVTVLVCHTLWQCWRLGVGPHARLPAPPDGVATHTSMNTVSK